MEPAVDPAQDRMNPSHKPNEFVFATTNTISGKNGRNASIKGSSTAMSGPKAYSFEITKFVSAPNVSQELNTTDVKIEVISQLKKRKI